MSLLVNHSLIKYVGPRILESAKTLVNAGNNSGVLTFSRAPQLGEMILIFTGNNTSTSTTTPTGFTLIQTLGSANKNYSFYKIATNAEASSYTINFSSTVDSKTIIGVIMTDFNPITPLGTSHSLIAGSSNTPQPLIAAGFSQGRKTIAFVHLKLGGNTRSASTVDNGFTILESVTDATTMQSLVAYKILQNDDAALTTTWAWTGGTTAFNANWIAINGRSTN